jgi:phospholipid transport system substrate-binding protein
MHIPGTGTAGIRVVLLLSVLLIATPLRAASDVTPLELVQDTSSRMLAALSDERDAIRRDPSHLYDLVSTIVLPYFDFERMSQWVLGKNWRTATPEQREHFVEQFRGLLVRTYGTALFDYADEKIIYLPFAGDITAPSVTVRTEIEHAGSTIPISYSMYRSRNGWKVYDVAISGISLVTNYRSSFGNIIRDEGIDSLIRQLADKNKS